MARSDGVQTTVALGLDVGILWIAYALGVGGAFTGYWLLILPGILMFLVGQYRLVTRVAARL